MPAGPRAAGSLQAGPRYQDGIVVAALDVGVVYPGGCRVLAGKKRILFFAEAVTLAHVVRPLVLAQSLPPENHEVHFACPVHETPWLKEVSFRHWPVDCIAGERFLNSLARGAPPYDRKTLRGYVEQDLSIIDAVGPDLVVGDFRLSLMVSCYLRKLRHVNICNAYWSPRSVDRGYPLPDHPAIGWFGLPVVSAMYRLLAPALLGLHSRVYNGFRREYGLPPLADLRQIYTAGDQVLYADVPSFSPLVELPRNHHFVGPVLWSPSVEPPAWWDCRTGQGECVYVTFGSSGAAALLPEVVAALAGMPFQVLVATGGRVKLPSPAPNVHVADFLPGIDAARRSRLVICNGGSPTAYQALSQGVPVLGIPSNMDQFLNMLCVERVQAGRLLRTQHVQPDRLRSLVSELVTNPLYSDNARRLAVEIAAYSAERRFPELVSRWLAPT